MTTIEAYVPGLDASDVYRLARQGYAARTRPGHWRPVGTAATVNDARAQIAAVAARTSSTAPGLTGGVYRIRRHGGALWPWTYLVGTGRYVARPA